MVSTGRLAAVAVALLAGCSGGTHISSPPPEQSFRTQELALDAVLTEDDLPSGWQVQSDVGNHADVLGEECKGGSPPSDSVTATSEPFSDRTSVLRSSSVVLPTEEGANHLLETVREAQDSGCLARQVVTKLRESVDLPFVGVEIESDRVGPGAAGDNSMAVEIVARVGLGPASTKVAVELVAVRVGRAVAFIGMVGRHPLEQVPGIDAIVARMRS